MFLIALWLSCSVAAALTGSFSFTNSTSSSSTETNPSFTSDTRITSTSSLQTSSGQTTDIGGYVAAGLGISSTSSSESTSSGSQTSRSLRSVTSPALLPSQTAGLSGSNRTDANSTSTPLAYGNTVTTSYKSYTVWYSDYTVTDESTTQVRSIAVNENSTVLYKTYTNTTWAPATNADECWTEWQSYWTMHPPVSASVTSSYLSNSKPLIFSTVAFTQTFYTAVSSLTVVTGMTTEQAPTVIVDGGFTQTVPSNAITLDYGTWTESTVDIPISTSTTTFDEIITPIAQTIWTVNGSLQTGWPTPGCMLPASYSSCQAEWETYVSRQVVPYPAPAAANCEADLLLGTAVLPACYLSIQASQTSWSSYVSAITEPTCTQAQITGAPCSSLKDAYVLGYNSALYPELLQDYQYPGVFSNGYYSLVPPWWTGWTWPATQEFAPGCTLDCGRCAVTGGTIQLLYFPPGLTHPATEPVVVTTLGTVLTSPTYYISFESLYASDACKGVGATITSTIIAIPTDQTLSTLFASTQACGAHIENNPWLGTAVTGTASFNVSDLLVSPVPYSIYTSQPYCISEIFAHGCLPDACPTDLPYRPLIVLSSAILNTLDPAWVTCSLDLRGFYDPPKALQPATAEAGPSITAASAMATVSATPGSSPTTATPAPTSTSQAQSTSQTVELESDSQSTSTSQPESAEPIIEESATSLIASSKSASELPATTTSPASPVGVIASTSEGISQTTQTAALPQISPAGTLNALSILSAAESSAASGAGDPATQQTADPVSPQAGDATTSPGKTAQNADPGNSATQSTAGAPSGEAGVVVNGQSVQAAQATTVRGIPVSVGSSAAVIAGSTVTIPSQGLSTTINGQAVTLLPVNSPADSDSTADSGSSGSGQDPADETDPSPSTFTIGSQVITATPGSPLVVAGSTLSTGAAVTVNGQTYSQGSGGLVIDGTTTVPLPAAAASAGTPTVVVAGSQTVTATPGKPLVIAGVTLSSGSAVVIEGQTYSEGSAGLVVDGSSTISLATAAAPVAARSSSVITVGSLTITATAGQPVVISGSTISVGGPAAVIGSQTFSEGANGLVVDGSTTIALPSATAAGVSTSVIVVGSQTITATADQPIVISGSTISAGGPAVVIGSQTYSEGANGLVVDGSTTIPLPSTASPTVLTLGSVTVTETPGRPVVIGTATLSSGAPAIVVDGETISNAGSAIIVNGTETVPLTGHATATVPTTSLTTSGSAKETGASGATATASSTKKSSAHHVTAPCMLSILMCVLIALA